MHFSILLVVSFVFLLICVNSKKTVSQSRIVSDKKCHGQYRPVAYSGYPSNRDHMNRP